MNLREVKQRILSVKSTQKITSAMKLVSSAKLHKAQMAVEGIRPYKDRLCGMFATLLNGSKDCATVYTAVGEVKRVAVVAVASSHSMCGSFNSNIIRKAKEVIEGYKADGIAVEVYPIGKKMAEAVNRTGVASSTVLLHLAGAPQYAPVAELVYDLLDRFSKGEIDRVDIVYQHSQSVARQVPVSEQFLPIDLHSMAADGEANMTEFIVEPGRREMIDELLPKIAALRLYTALLDSAAAEHAARMLAMQIATENAGDLIAELTLEYNKGRQQAITNELLDIVAGSAR
jgi:F-type H+-transporting ATPase subunit gamma